MYHVTWFYNKDFICNHKNYVEVHVYKVYKVTSVIYCVKLMYMHILTNNILQVYVYKLSILLMWMEYDIAT